MPKSLWILAGGCGAIFITWCVLLLPWLGLQQDEVLFAMPWFRPAADVQNIAIGGAQWPVMIMTYVGALKSYLYAPLFRALPISALSVRLPALLLCALTIPLAGFLTWRWHGTRAAQFAMLLVALDPTYLATATFDWGPVVLQHVLFLLLLLFLDDFRQSQRLAPLAVAATVAGLGLWDKALFAFALAGAVASFAVDVWYEGWHPKRKHLIVAVAFGALGAAPLLFYNAERPGATVRSNAHFETSGAALMDKCSSLWHSLDGSPLLGYLVREPTEAPLTAGTSLTDRLPLDLGGHTVLPWLMVAALLWHRGTRFRRDPALLRIAIILLVGYTIMFAAGGVGGAPHHSVLLWPLPHMLLAILLANIASASTRAKHCVLAAVAFTLASEVLVLNEYLWREKAYGASGYWTDASQPLTAYLGRQPGPVYVTDWGIENPVTVLSGGKIEIHSIDPNLEHLDEPAWVTAYRNSLRPARFVVHTPKNLALPHSTQALEALLRRLSLVPEKQATIYDRQSRPIFEVWNVKELSK